MKSRIFGQSVESVKSQLVNNAIEKGFNPEFVRATLAWIDEYATQPVTEMQVNPEIVETLIGGVTHNDINLTEKPGCTGCIERCAPEVPRADYFAGDLEEVAGVIHNRLEIAAKKVMNDILHPKNTENRNKADIVYLASKLLAEEFCKVGQDIATPGYVQRICEDI